MPRVNVLANGSDVDAKILRFALTRVAIVVQPIRLMNACESNKEQNQSFDFDAIDEHNLIFVVCFLFVRSKLGAPMEQLVHAFGKIIAMQLTSMASHRSMIVKAM